MCTFACSPLSQRSFRDMTEVKDRGLGITSCVNFLWSREELGTDFCLSVYGLIGQYSPFNQYKNMSFSS